MSQLKHGGAALAAVHRASNHRKHEAYWLGFLKGVLASEKIEQIEVPSLRVEAGRLLALTRDEDAAEILRDLDTDFDDFHGEVYGVVESIVEHRQKTFGAETPKDVINGFYGFCAGIACDNRILPKEVERLIAEIDGVPCLMEDSRIASLRGAAARAIEDGIVTLEESEDIASWICRLVGDSCADTGLATFGNVPVVHDALRDHTQVTFPDRVFVVTGTFTMGPRKIVTAYIEARGGLVGNSLTQRTDYLAFGVTASRDWKHSHEGHKLIRARELREAGGKPHLVDEAVLGRALKTPS